MCIDHIDPEFVVDGVHAVVVVGVVDQKVHLLDRENFLIVNCL